MVNKKSKNFKKVLIVLLSTILVILSSCFIEEKIESSRRIEMNSIDGINMVIKDGTLTKTGASIIITDTTNQDNTYSGGCDYRIDKKINNNWQEMKKIKNLPYTMQAFIVDENNKLEFDIDWSITYGELETGEYRLVKNTDIENKLYEFTVEFEIS